MPFPYRFICDLLQELDDESRKEKKAQLPAKAIIKTWFREHRSRLVAPENDASAILSTLLPERRTDRVYFIQAPKLEGIFGKALLLGVSRMQELRRYTTPGLGVDLADCVESILARTPNALQESNELTVEEIDDTLSCIAAACRFSSPSVKASRRYQNAKEQNQSLANIYRRLSARDAKWFTRLVLKNYQPVVMDERLLFCCYHVLLPQMMKVRDDFTIATALLRRISQSPHDQSAIASILKPSIGTKVGRQPWFKGRSIKHCMDMGGSREVSCEQKIDGEYCQIHIDLRKPQSIQIFSKSGKDSTQDRVGLHKPHPYEHLMVVYYDALLIDNESLLGVRHSERFKRLSDLITCRKGYAELVPREIISLSRPSAASRLREAFAKCIISRGEGLVLKPDEPYFDFSTAQKSHSCCNIKLKKEYVQGWGEVGDFAVIGASYDASKAREYKIPNVKWTHFFIGCLENKGKARAKTEKPRFIVTNIVELSEDLLSTIRTQCFPSPVPFKLNGSILLDFGQKEMVRPTDVFLEPLVFDMRCFSFDKRPNTNFWSMRFPVVSKIHHDRSYWDAITFSELQEVALNATEMPQVEDSQEMLEWVSALEKSDPRGIAVDAMSQQSAFAETGTSPVSLPKIHQEKETRDISTPGPTKKADPRGQLVPSHHDIVLPTCVSLTPSRSSAVEDAERYASPEVSKNSPVKLGRRKRLSLDTAVTNTVTKRRRGLSNASAQPGRTNQSGDSLPDNPRDRQPLSQISANSSLEHTPTKFHSRTAETSTSHSLVPMSASSPIITNRGSLPIDRHNTASGIPPSPSSYFLGGGNMTIKRKEQLEAGCCSLAGGRCAFSNCSILLSPCISQYAWITDNLLRDHGIGSFLVDPRLWCQAVTLQGSLDESTSSDIVIKHTSSRSVKKIRTRKICLVDSRRKEATAEFIRKIEEAGLKRKNGKREWIAVYDWRILEDVKDLESTKGRQRNIDPWRNWYVGIA
ncbi:hypothetical protein AAE478_004292 [Parahypoxylon ruwenzoriense]